MKRAVLWLLLIFCLTACTDVKEESGDRADKEASTVETTESRPGTSARMTDIHDIKPLSAPGIDWRIPAAVLAALILAVLAIGLIMWRLKRKRPPAKDVVTLPPPDVEALALLKALEPVDVDHGREFYFRLSAIIRRYIRRRYHIDAPEMTAEELIPEIEKVELTADLNDGLRELIVFRDPIRFAGRPASDRTMRTDLSFAREFVEKSTVLMAAQTEASKEVSTETNV
jgi:hypothetical protein